MTNELEIEWLIDAQQGNVIAFDLLHESLQPDITRFVRRLIGYEHLQVEDIVQDTFLTLYTHLQEIDPPEKLRPYLFRVARNRCYDLLRKQGRYEQLSLDDEPVAVRVSFNSQRLSDQPDEVAHWLLLHLEVQEAMEALPETQRQVLILYAEEGFSYSEIAQVLEVSLGTVKSRLHHAKKNLRRLLKPETLLAISDKLAEPETPSKEDVTPKSETLAESHQDNHQELPV